MTAPRQSHQCWLSTVDTVCCHGAQQPFQNTDVLSHNVKRLLLVKSKGR